jgi:hypothetical protein
MNLIDVNCKLFTNCRNFYAYCGRPNHTGSAERHMGQLSSRSSHSATHALWKMCEWLHGILTTLP